jgi:DNA-binding transcriptional ArsR family regulator
VGLVSTSQPWSASLVDLVAKRLSLLADPTRVRLLTLLEERESSVQQLADKTDNTPQNVSRHLCILYRGGIVARRRDGNSILYSVADYSACRLLDQTLESIRGQVEELADIVKLAA